VTDAAAFQAFRAGFPGAAERPYMDVAARGLISRPVRQALDAYLDARMLEGGDKAAMFETVEASRTAFARLIGADADEVAIVKNISDGVNAVATGIDWRPGDKVVIATELEHPANIFPWVNLAKSDGVKIVAVQTKASGVMPAERMAAAVGPGVRAVAVSTVSFSPGFRTNLAPLAAACQKHGALLVVDSAQSAGIIAHDVRAEGIDVLAASTQKGLLGLYGMGFLYVRRAVAEAVSPAYLSRMGVALEDGHEASSGDIEAFRHARGARRFDVGNYNYIGATAARRSIEGLLDLGPKRIDAYTLDLATRLRQGLQQAGAAVMEPPDDASRSHIVAVGSGLADVHDGAEDPAVLALHERLNAGNVAHSLRRGVIRLSLHAYNDADDVEKVLDLARMAD